MCMCVHPPDVLKQKYNKEKPAVRVKFTKKFFFVTSSFFLSKGP